MAEYKVGRVLDQGHAKIRNVPIAVTPEGFWCCPSPIAFQKTLKAHSFQNKAKNVPKKQNPVNERKTVATPSISGILNDNNDDDVPSAVTVAVVERPPKPSGENVRQKVTIEFGDRRTSDLKVFLRGKQGYCVKMSVHKSVLMENSTFFVNRFSQVQQQSPISCFEIDDCEDIESYVETVGLMYCTGMKQRLTKQNVPRVLRILKVAELLEFQRCIQSCLEYLEAVPWIGEEEEEKVVSSVLHLRSDNKVQVSPLLKRVSSDISCPPIDTLTNIMELVLKSNEERGRCEMKSLVLKLLKENNNLLSTGDYAEICNRNIYNSCQNCFSSLLLQFRKAAEPGFNDHSIDSKGPVAKIIAFEADNLIWLLEILSDRQATDEFVLIWADQQELATLHSKLPIISRYLVSCITAKIFVSIGKGQMLPSKETRQKLIQTWFQPLIDDYYWLQHGCRSIERKVVEEGIGRTILTLPLEEQQTILLSWLGSFLKAGDNCPNLQRAFEVWWRRTFGRPHTLEQQGTSRSKVML